MSMNGLMGAFAALNGYFDEDVKRKEREQKDAAAKREAERFDWEREDQQAKREMRPIEQEARRSTLSNQVSRDTAEMKTRPGATANTIKQQGLESKRLDYQTENLPTELARLKAQGLIDDEKTADIVQGHLGNYLANGNYWGATVFANKIASHPEVLSMTNGVKITGFSPVKGKDGKITGYEIQLEDGSKKIKPIEEINASRARVNAGLNAPVLNQQKVEADIQHSKDTGRAALTNAGANASRAATDRLQLTAPSIVQGNETGSIVRPQIVTDPKTKQPVWADPVITPNKDIPAKGGVRGMSRDQYDALVKTSTSEFEKNIGFTANPLGQMMMPEGLDRDVYAATKAQIEQAVRTDGKRDANGHAAAAAEVYNRAVAIRKASPKLSAQQAVDAAISGEAGVGKAAKHLVDD